MDEEKQAELSGELSIFVNSDGDTVTYAIFAGESHILIDRTQAMVLADALKVILRSSAEMPQEIVN